jgi:hypothetical protein|tara:strand:- start:36 stop:680 length:645 start_codon:yes stop_codon:yes gene_type:complete
MDSPSIVAMMFTSLDTDGNGYVDVGELRHLFVLLGMVDYDDDDFIALEKKLLAQFDGNHDERLDFSEFTKLLIFAKEKMADRVDDITQKRRRASSRGSARVRARLTMAEADSSIAKDELLQYVEEVAGSTVFMLVVHLLATRPDGAFDKIAAVVQAYLRDEPWPPAVERLVEMSQEEYATQRLRPFIEPLLRDILKARPSDPVQFLLQYVEMYT